MPQRFAVLTGVIFYGLCALVMAQESSGVMDHSHLPISVPAGVPGPELSLHLHQDTMTGYNLKLVTSNFNLIPPPPEATDMEAQMGVSVGEQGFIEGHAHLYINGIKVQRLYGRDVHLPASRFKPGVNQISVSINNHGHMYWVNDDRQVLATLFIDPTLKEPVIHRFESFPTERAQQ